MFIRCDLGRGATPRGDVVKHRLGWKVRRRIAAYVMFLGAATNGCDGASVPLTWTASGAQLTGLEMPLDRQGTFIVAEYALVGRERFGRNTQDFRDRMLLTIHDQGIQSHVLGYITRTYDRGQVRTFRLVGTPRRVAQDAKTMIVTGRAHGVGTKSGISYAPMAWVEIRLDPTTGRISAKGS